MAEDSQEPSSLPGGASNTQTPDSSANSQTPKYEPSQSQTGKLWDAFGNPEEPANALAQATYKPRGKNPKDVPYSEIIGSVSLSEMSTVHKRPCARESLLTGIGVGFGVGGLRGVLKGRYYLWSAGNWAVGMFAISSLASYEYCRWRRNRELSGMAEALDLMNQLKAKKQREKAAAEEEAALRARLAEEEKKSKSWTNPSNYKFW
ncbi:Cytochrome oxidase biogenesis protein Cox20 subunit [Penicillium paradoxum]|uniref:Cytochrome oxidase biogenesis protein Cox20 subunit n=1 Tax=Penicillium paradoxum TaxID=176176 RepID=UPI0025478F42|nr:Cytochrome oxidase biogenesis protein Cox20 subunit [Penicillium paradoxum]KAJ5773602.1 Cytochrome oxidase biogenesis protein Cox20 subunit [Penicillium paradoxum]